MISTLHLFAKGLSLKGKASLSIFVVSMVLISGISTALAADVTLLWDPNSESDLAGYKVYAGTTSGTFGFSVNVGNQTSFTATGLGSGTYYFAVTAYDTSGAESVYSNEVSVTINPSDTTPPVISSVQATSITSGGATISWTTNEPSNTQVEYGLNTAYGSSTALDASLVTTHSQSLGGLAPGTLYHYRVKSRDGAGNQAISGDFTFTATSAPDTTLPIVTISSPASGATVSGTVTVSASASDNVGVTGVQFLLDGANLEAEDVTAPYSVSWNTVTASNGSHMLSARARDAAGNQATATTVQVTVQNATPPSGLSAAYGFAEGSGTVTADASGNSNTGSLSGAFWNAHGRFDSSLAFNGGNSYVSAGVNGVSSIGSPQTVCWWLFVPSIPTTTQTVISLDGPNAGIYPGFKNSTVGVWKKGLLGNDVLVSAAPPSANAWHHYAYSFNGSTHRLYIDGVEKANAGQLVGQNGAPTSLQFGRCCGGSQYFFGLLDEVRIYNKALTQAEIQMVMNLPVVAQAPAATSTTSPTMDPPLTLAAADDLPTPDKVEPTETQAPAAAGSGDASKIQSTLFYPRLVVKAEGAKSRSEHTGLTLVNLDRVQANLRITALDRFGSRISGRNITNPASLVLKAGTQLQIVEDKLFGSGLRAQNPVGWLKVESTSKNIVGSFLTFDGAMSVADGAAASSETLTAFVLPEIEDQGFTQLHLANPTSDSATITLDLLRADGTQRATVTRRVQGNGSLAEFFTDLFPGITAVASDYILVRSDKGVVPFQLLGKSSRYLEGLNGQDAQAGATTLYNPQYSVGGGQWRSALSVVNLDSQPGLVTVRFIRDDGTQIGRTSQMSISGNGKIQISDQTFLVDGGDTLVQGYLEITSSGPKLAGSAVFGDRGRSVFSAVSPLITKLHKAVIFSQLTSNDTYFTALALINPNDTVAQATIDVFDSNGALIVSKVVSVPARNRKSQLLTEYFPDLIGQNSGYIKVTSDIGLASLVLFGARDLSVLSAVPGQVVP